MDIQNILVPLVLLYWIGIGTLIITSIKALLLFIKALKLYISNENKK